MSYFTGQEEWLNDVELYQQEEATQMLLPDSANCVAIQAFLKINNLSFQVVEKKNAEFMSPSGSIPFIKCGAIVISDFERIVSFISEKVIGKSQTLEKVEKADLRAYISLVNNIFSYAELYFSWCDPEIYNSFTWPRYSSVFSWPLNYILTWQKKRSIHNKLNVLGWKKKTATQVVFNQ